MNEATPPNYAKRLYYFVVTAVVSVAVICVVLFGVILPNVRSAERSEQLHDQRVACYSDALGSTSDMANCMLGG